MRPSMLETTSVTHLSNFRRHSHIAKAGDHRSSIYRIKHGWACRYQSLPDGKRQITNLYLPGDLCEPHWLLAGQAALPVMCLTPLTALRIPITQIHQSKRPDVKDVLGAMVADYERQAKWLVQLGRGTAAERLVFLLSDLWQRLGPSESTVHIPLTQVEIADIVGLTSVHTNRVLHSLEREGIVELHGRSLSVTRKVAPEHSERLPSYA